MRVSTFVASDEATAGSVIANADRIRPSSSGSSHSLRCASVPNSASTSMFPVSGAEQFSAAGAMAGLRPVISASGAYCRLVRPAPCEPGRNRFHSPRLRASTPTSAMIGGNDHGFSRLRDCSACTGSAGYTHSSMNASSRSR